MSSEIIRQAEVCRLTGLSYSTIYRMEREEHFPRRRRLGPNSVGWLSDEVQDWISQRARVYLAPLPNK